MLLLRYAVIRWLSSSAPAICVNQDTKSILVPETGNLGSDRINDLVPANDTLFY
jgi:hypothetical protein